MKEKDVIEQYGADGKIVIPRFAWESYNASHERTVRRLIAGWLLTVLLFAALAFVAIHEWSSWDYADVTVDSGAGGNANYIGANARGVIDNGEGESENTY